MAEFSDPRIPESDACVVGPLIDRFAAETPEAVFAVFDTGESWSYAQLREIVRRTAAGLAGIGVRKGDHVAVWLPNGPDALRAWFAINYLGAVCVPINLAYRGAILEHALALSDVRAIIAHSGLCERLAGIDTARVETVIVPEGTAGALPGLNCVGAEALDADAVALDGVDREVKPWDLQCLMFTSGTTGPSKAVMTSYLHHFSVCDYIYRELGPNDRFMVNLPLFHVGGTVPVTAMLMRGGSIALVESFRASEFWETVNRYGTNCVTLLSSMTPLVSAAPETAKDADNALDYVFMVPLVQDARRFGKRFGCKVYTLFNMTEVSMPLASELYPEPLGSCGRPRPGVEARIVDENDLEVPVGTVGELILRCDTPWAFTSGYYKNPEATARAWRNGWFHTGDAFRMDEKGNYFFADRIKDAIRRRGENISSFEVEAEVSAHPNVKECAVVAVRDAHGDEEVMAVMVLNDATGFDPMEMSEFYAARMPHYMVPRYLRIVDEMPRTPTQKIQKNVLRDLGVTETTWDREAAGMVLKRAKLGGT